MAPRRTTRNITKRKRDENSDQSASEEEHVKPVAKQPRRRPRGKLGALANLLSMPLDVVYEILSCLEPMDLLNLAKTSKVFRQLLMSRKSAHVWKTVIESTDNIPNCPDEICPPAFVNLLYCSFCHKCGKGPCEKIYWDCWARYCNSCKNTIGAYYNLNRDPWSKLSIRGSIGATNVPTPLNYIPIYTIVPLIHEGDINLEYLSSRKEVVLHQPTMEAITKELSELHDEIEIETYIKTKARRLEVLRNNIESLARWQRAKEFFRAKSNDNLRKERLASIKDKLILLGYEPFLDKIVTRSFCDNPLVSQPKALTDRVWSNIQAKIIEIAEPIRQAQLKQEMGSRVARRIHVLDEAIFKIKPRRRNDLSLRDITLYMPQVKELLCDPSAKEPTIADFEFIRTALPEYEENWRSSARQYLCDLARKSLGFDVEDPLSLAVGSVFICDFCHLSCSWPNILAHTCTARVVDFRESTSVDDFFTLAVIRVPALPSLTWRPTGYSLHVDKAKAIIEAHGLPAMTVGLEEMDRSPTRMTCPRHNAKHTVSIMNWRAMFEHAASNKCSADDWKVIDDDAQIEAAKPLEEIARANLESYYQRRDDYVHTWRCAHCPIIKANQVKGAQLTGHLLRCHQIEKPSAEDYVYSGPFSANGTITVDLLDEKMKDDWHVRHRKTDTAAWYPLT